MKVLFSTISLISLLAMLVSCERSPQRQEDFEREKPIREDDIREDDNYKRNLPMEKQEIDPNIEVMEFESDTATENN